MAKQAQFKKEELQEAFTMYCSADNTIPCSRLAAVIRSVGGAPTEEKIRHLCTEFESKGKKTLTLQEVDAIWTKYTFAPVPADELRDAFRIFDKDGNGMINAGELRHVLTNLGEKLTDEEVDEMIREADLNGDNQINYAEFVKVMQDGC
ncbi:calmodulin-2/4-like [Pomacea canaliculata]|uniref:calmodulin-2/4-like n=1 Tax=Pomacea canaliculata TaxID=400727 RepID=UPI000D7257DD|nr:calmodulin-2/4-like [Pomacea canaliculata]